MNEKTSQILQNLKSITQKEPVEENTSGSIASNLDNDRIYSNLHNDIHLINKDGSKYKGKIFKRRITLKDIDGGNFFAHAYETDDGRYLIILNGVSRFKITEEISTKKLYRVCKINYENFASDIVEKKEKINFSNLELIFKNVKNLFEKKGFMINWSELKNQDLNLTINTLSMVSPFSLEEKQTLLETIDIKSRKSKLEEILKTYILDEFNNTTLQ